jgi:hypothetical protein
MFSRAPATYAVSKEKTPQRPTRASKICASSSAPSKTTRAEAQAAGEEASLAGLLERVTLVSDVDGLEDVGRVVLMTVHGAKGLEFERVILTGMEEEMFPYKGVLDPGRARRAGGRAPARLRRHHPGAAAPDDDPHQHAADLRQDAVESAESLLGRATEGSRRIHR